jgi:hypothetical protein
VDKQVTRAAASGASRILMYGRWWPLRRGGRYHVKFNRRAPGGSQVREMVGRVLQPIERFMGR